MTKPISNSTTASNELKQFIERVERLQSEKASLATDEKEVFSEAKGRGYDVKVMRKIISERKRNSDDVAEEEAILEMYREALGMSHSLVNTPDEDDDDGIV